MTPTWVQVIQALATPAIAGAVAVIGYFQWRTGHQRVVLDLFDRRLRVYDAVSGLNRRVMGAGRATIDDGREMTALWREARFLFQDDVVAQLGTLADAMLDAETATSELSDLPAGEERSEQVRKRRAALTRIEEAQQRIPDLFASYMRMDMKVAGRPRR